MVILCTGYIRRIFDETKFVIIFQLRRVCSAFSIEIQLPVSQRTYMYETIRTAIIILIYYIYIMQ